MTGKKVGIPCPGNSSFGVKLPRKISGVCIQCRLLAFPYPRLLRHRGALQGEDWACIPDRLLGATGPRPLRTGVPTQRVAF